MEKLAIVFSVINCKIELIWNILLNMKIINKYSGIISDIVNYEGNIIQKNDIIELIFYEETNKIEKKYTLKSKIIPNLQINFIIIIKHYKN